MIPDGRGFGSYRRGDPGDRDCGSPPEVMRRIRAIPFVHVRQPGIAAGLLLLLALCPAGCGGPTGAGEPARAAADNPAPRAEAPASPGTRAPAPSPVDVDELLAAVKGSASDAVLVNVWATWCIPCREEFPDLIQLHRRYAEQGFELVLVSADFDVGEAELVEFLSKQGVDFPSYLKVGNDMDFIDGINPDWSGALPASFLFDSEGNLKKFWEGKTTYKDLEEPVRGLLEEKENKV
jgi:thiol-disulfide isomerase/thioredoxin